MKKSGRPNGSRNQASKKGIGGGRRKATSRKSRLGDTDLQEVDGGRGRYRDRRPEWGRKVEVSEGEPVVLDDNLVSALNPKTNKYEMMSRKEKDKKGWE